MSKKENKQQDAEKDLNKKSDKKLNNSSKIQEKAQSFTTTVTLVDCTYCEELQNELEKTKKFLTSSEEIRFGQEEKILELQHIAERNAAMYEYTLECLKWAEEHLGFFALRKYKSIFTKSNFVDFIIRRRNVNIATGSWIDADADAEILDHLRDE